MYTLNPSSGHLGKSPSVKSLIEWGTKLLENNGIDESRLNAELLVCEILKCTRADLRSSSEKNLDDKSVTLYTTLINRRINREPLQYILGSTEFMGLSFVVNRSVFIPRPETELLVGLVREICTSDKGEINRILDIGTGSGNIAVSIAKYCDDIIIDAVDSDREALIVADKNIVLNNLNDRINTFICDIFGDCREIGNNRYDMVVSNPPYVTEPEYLTLEPEVRDYEPRQACTDGADGLTFYKRITEVCRFMLREGGHLLVEIGYGQGQMVTDIFSHAGFRNIKMWKDYAGYDRIIGGERLSL